MSRVLDVHGLRRSVCLEEFGGSVSIFEIHSNETWASFKGFTPWIFAWISFSDVWKNVVSERGVRGLCQGVVSGGGVRGWCQGLVSGGGARGWCEMRCEK